MDLPGTVRLSDEFTVNDEDGNLTSIGLNIEGEDLGILIGRRGQTMVSLQYIVRLIMSHKMQVQIPIVLDVEGYKQRRCEGLRILANRLAEQVKTRKTPFTMEPMPAFERRIIHCPGRPPGCHYRKHRRGRIPESGHHPQKPAARTKLFISNVSRSGNYLTIAFSSCLC